MNERRDRPAQRGDGTKEAKRFGAPRPVSALVAPLTRRALGKHGFASASLISDWATIIGDELAASCQPVKLAFPQGKRDGGTLHLHVTGGAALEIQHITPQIVERINGHLGYGAVARLKLIQGQAPRGARATRRRLADRGQRHQADEKHWDGLDDITDPALRESLRRLGTAIAERESTPRK